MEDDNNKIRLPISLTMMDGRQLMGDLVVNIGGTMERTLNNDAKFISFCPPGGEPILIAKNGIMEAASRRTAKVVNLPTEAKVEDTDPYQLLGVAKTATDDEIRQAYLARAKEYHSDRLANANLPDEVLAYTDAMSRRINEAYALLSRKEPQRQAQGAPIYS